MHDGPDDRRFKPVLGIAPEGLPIIFAVFGVTTCVACLVWYFAPPAAGILAAIVAIVITAWAFWFFRDPERLPPTDTHALLSGADGVVSFVGPGAPPVELGLSPDETRGMTRVSIFMNIFNVHVNRAPTNAAVERIAYRPGKFFNASLDKASEHNERLSILLRTPAGEPLVVVQIAGLIARRIVCRATQGDTLAAGERFGLIRFGSRVDHYLPPTYRPSLTVGERTVAGQTVIARHT